MQEVYNLVLWCLFCFLFTWLWRVTEDSINMNKKLIEFEYRIHHLEGK